MLNSVQNGVIFISLVKWFLTLSVALCTILLDTIILVLKGTVCCAVESSQATVFRLGRASVRSVKFVDRAGGGLILLLQVGCEKSVKDCIGKDVLAIV